MSDTETTMLESCGRHHATPEFHHVDTCSLDYCGRVSPGVTRGEVLRLVEKHGVTSGRSYTRLELKRYRESLVDDILALLSGD